MYIKKEELLKKGFTHLPDGVEIFKEIKLAKDRYAYLYFDYHSISNGECLVNTRTIDGIPKRP